MSQHDYDLANDAGLPFRADLNLVLAAILSNNSGASEPATITASMLWYDITNSQLKLRNEANDAWEVVFPLEQAESRLVGEIIVYGGSTAPEGWLFCNNQEVSRTTYAALFAIIGESFGSGDSVNTFNVPDFRGRAPMGVGTGDAADATAYALGEKEGTEKHALSEAELPSHNHGPTNDPGDHVHSLPVTSGYEGSRSGFDHMTDGTALVSYFDSDAEGAHTHTMNAIGGNSPHNNLQPSLGVNFIIKT